MRRLRHRLRPSPPSFRVHDPKAIAAELERAGFARWRSDHGWFVAHH